MKPLEFTYDLFEKNCQKQGIANWIDGPDSYLPAQRRLDRDKYSEAYFMCMRREMDESIPKLEKELDYLRFEEVSLFQIGIVEGQIALLKNILGYYQSSTPR